MALQIEFVAKCFVAMWAGLALFLRIMLVFNMPKEMEIPFRNKIALFTYKRVEADLNS